MKQGDRVIYDGKDEIVVFSHGKETEGVIESQFIKGDSPIWSVYLPAFGQTQYIHESNLRLVNAPVEDKPMTDATANRLADAMEELAHRLETFDTYDLRELADALNGFNK